ncbi:hypothetical protein [Streptomyces sp. NPDC096323]|uniref:hypothetical protein n=1 Tax=Streptomyces sp. NPDC096323 TaxID=3155822 RepID=UPI003327003A
MTDHPLPGRPCLHELAAQRRLPAHQPMDQVTLGWIRDNRPANFDATPTLPRAGHMLVPDKAWFATEPQATGVHGVRHNARVSLLAVLIAQEHGLGADDVAALCAAGAVHDCRRRDDRTDQGHGQRAAAWLLGHATHVTRALGRDLPTPALHRAAQAIALHDVPHDQFTADQERAYQQAPHLPDVLKAADCLDRYRLPLHRWWPQTAQLRITVPGWLPPAAFALVVRSEQAALDGADDQHALTAARRSLTPRP